MLTRRKALSLKAFRLGGESSGLLFCQAVSGLAVSDQTDLLSCFFPLPWFYCHTVFHSTEFHHSHIFLYSRRPVIRQTDVKKNKDKWQDKYRNTAKSMDSQENVPLRETAISLRKIYNII